MTLSGKISGNRLIGRVIFRIPPVAYSLNSGKFDFWNRERQQDLTQVSRDTERAGRLQR